MKIALLNLPVDNNYGGNLQRYALMKVLQDMGHDVTHIYLRTHVALPWYRKPISYGKRIIKKILFNDKCSLFMENEYNRIMNESIGLSLEFYNKYIKHTNICENINDVIEATRGKFDVYVVGSDQVWRKECTAQIGLTNYFLKFTAKENVKRFAYAVSFGLDNPNISWIDKIELGNLYRCFNGVSVRETSAMNLLSSWKWNTPMHHLCIDPTMLLDQKDYVRLINENQTSDITNNKIYAYILDKSDEIMKKIDNLRKRLKKDVVVVTLEHTSSVSIPQWLNNIRLCDYMITDSYHGVVFAIIFRRPFYFLGNKNRGNTRIESLFQMLQVGDSIRSNFDYSQIESRLNYWRSQSMEFLDSVG